MDGRHSRAPGDAGGLRSWRLGGEVNPAGVLWSSVGPARERAPMSHGRNFGRHVRSLRRARGLTQEQLAESSGLSADTIRRLEHGSFSPSLDTLRKLCAGLALQLHTLFGSFELGERDVSRELRDLILARGPRELRLACKVLRALFEALDAGEGE